MTIKQDSPAVNRPALYPVLVLVWCAVLGFALTGLLVRGFGVPAVVAVSVALVAAAPLIYRSLRVRWTVTGDALLIFGVLVNRSVPVDSIVDFELRKSLLPASALLTAVRTEDGNSWRVPSTLRLNDRAQGEALKALRVSVVAARGF